MFGLETVILGNGEDGTVPTVLIRMGSWVASEDTHRRPRRDDMEGGEAADSWTLTSVAASVLFNCGEGTRRLCNEHHFKLGSLAAVAFMSCDAPAHAGLASVLFQLSDGGKQTLPVLGPSKVRDVKSAIERFYGRKYPTMDPVCLGGEEPRVLLRSTRATFLGAPPGASWAVRGIPICQSALQERNRDLDFVAHTPSLPAVPREEPPSSSSASSQSDGEGRSESGSDDSSEDGSSSDSAPARSCAYHMVLHPGAENGPPVEFLLLPSAPPSALKQQPIFQSIANRWRRDGRRSWVIHMGLPCVVRASDYQAWVDTLWPAGELTTHVWVHGGEPEDIAARMRRPVAGMPARFLFGRSAEDQLEMHQLCPELCPAPYGLPSLPPRKSVDPLTSIAYWFSRGGRAESAKMQNRAWLTVLSRPLLPRLPPAIPASSNHAAAASLRESMGLPPRASGTRGGMVEDMKAPPSSSLVLLGTGSAAPSTRRNCSGILLRSPDGCYLFDAGEGTLGAWQRSSGPDWVAELRDLRLLWLSHQHADHHTGVMTILTAFTALAGASPPALVMAPPSVLRILHHLQDASSATLYARFCPIHHRSGLHLRDLARESTTRGPAAGEAPPAKRPRTGQRDRGEFVPATLRSVPVIHCREAQGIVVTATDGRKLVISGDTRPCVALEEAGRGAWLLVHEATFGDDRAEEAVRKKHSTVGEARAVGRRMGAKFILLTHLSQRYAQLAAFSAAWDAANTGAWFAADGMTVPLDATTESQLAHWRSKMERAVQFRVEHREETGPSNGE